MDIAVATTRLDAINPDTEDKTMQIEISNQGRSAVYQVEQMLDCIGNPAKTDHSIAKLLVDYEREFRALVRDVLGQRT